MFQNAKRICAVLSAANPDRGLMCCFDSLLALMSLYIDLKRVSGCTETASSIKSKKMRILIICLKKSIP